MPHLFYHIVCRGNRRDPLFKEVNDFRAFLHILEQLHEKIPFEIASYCFMTNGLRACHAPKIVEDW
ncbi:hypothetical protein [Anoxybacillus sp. CHMUD]|uniref:hypothetical protein n=1 Tax=Anoxybacillus sp. CHMUD TaxID=2508870 RepID=UPI0035C7852C